MRARVLISIGISCIAGVIMALLLICILPEASPQPEVETDEDVEELSAEDEIQVVMAEAVEIPAINTQKRTPAEIPEAPPEITTTPENAASDHLAEAESPRPSPAKEIAAEPQDMATPAGVNDSPQRIELSRDELETFIRTQTVNNRARAFPRIHITYRDVDMNTQLSFYKTRGYGFLAVEIKNGVVTGVLGKIDMEKNQLCAVDRDDGVAWNYASVITGSEYRRLAVNLSGNSHAYLAVAPSHRIVNIILGSIDKGINGVLDGDYGSHQSYKAIFTTRGNDVILTVMIPDRNSFTRREILLSGI